MIWNRTLNYCIMLLICLRTNNDETFLPWLSELSSWLNMALKTGERVASMKRCTINSLLSQTKTVSVKESVCSENWRLKSTISEATLVCEFSWAETSVFSFVVFSWYPILIRLLMRSLPLERNPSREPLLNFPSSLESSRNEAVKVTFVFEQISFSDPSSLTKDKEKWLKHIGSWDRFPSQIRTVLWGSAFSIPAKKNLLFWMMKFGPIMESSDDFALTQFKKSGMTQS